MQTSWCVGLTVCVCVATTGARAEDWTGAQLGVGYGWAEVDIPDFRPTLPGTAEVTSVFAGYDRDLGQTIVGVELEWSGSDVRTENLDFRVTEILRTKFRAGYDVGRALTYAFVGFAAADMLITEGGLQFPREGFGASIGFGVEFGVTPSLAVGAEFAMDRLNTSGFEYLDNSSDRFDLQTISVRASWQF